MPELFILHFWCGVASDLDGVRALLYLGRNPVSVTHLHSRLFVDPVLFTSPIEAGFHFRFFLEEDFYYLLISPNSDGLGSQFHPEPG